MEATAVDKEEELELLKKVSPVFTLPASRVFVFVTLSPKSQPEKLLEYFQCSPVLSFPSLP